MLAIHILRKDIRLLWPQLFLAIAIMAAFAISATDPETYKVTALWLLPHQTLFTMLLPLAWWFLIASAIGADSPIGPDQYWLSRPIHWKDLVVAKAALFILGIQLPFAVSDTFILAHHGFPIWEYLPGFALRQFLLAAGVVLPGAAVAAITRSLPQFLLWAIVLFWGFRFIPRTFAPYFNPYWGSLEWMRMTACGAVALVACAAVVLIQYSRRRLVLSRTITITALAIVSLAYVVVPLDFAVALDEALTRRPVDIQVQAAGQCSVWDVPRPGPGQEMYVSLFVPLRFTGIPAGNDVFLQGSVAHLDSASGDSISTEGGFWHRPIEEGRLYDQSFQLNNSFFQYNRDKLVDIHLELSFTLHGPSKITEVPSGSTTINVPAVGNCELNTEAQPGALVVSCHSPMNHSGPAFVEFVTTDGTVRRDSRIGTRYFPSTFLPLVPLDPITHGSTFFTLIAAGANELSGPADPRQIDSADAKLIFHSANPLAHFKKSVYLKGVRLGDNTTSSPESFRRGPARPTR